MLELDTAGDPVSGDKWIACSTGNIAELLNRQGIKVCANTVAKILTDMGYRLRVNRKTIESGLKNPPDPKVRDAQFRYLNKQRRLFERNEWPVISVDTKARELIGRFHQAGKRWSKEPVHVFDHDFPSSSSGVALPYGIYDTMHNHGFINLGISYDTSEFAVDSICVWWRKFGRKRYPGTSRLLILADCGGSNSNRHRLWKYELHRQLCKQHGLQVQVCHFPPGSSKWNPIEHRLFSEISRTWQAVPLESHDIVINTIRATKTKTGLKVCARLNTKTYRKGRKITDQMMNAIQIEKRTIRPKWNYELFAGSS